MVDLHYATNATWRSNQNRGLLRFFVARGSLVCGQGGIFELTTSNAFSNIYPVKTFNFGVGALGDLYIGISAAYGGFGWPQGFYAPAVSTTVLDNVDINALVVTEGCE